MFEIKSSNNSFTLTKDGFYLGNDGTNLGDVKLIIKTHVQSVLEKYNILRKSVFFKVLPYSEDSLVCFKPQDYEILKYNNNLVNDLIDIEYMVPVIEKSLVKLPVVKEMTHSDFAIKKKEILKYFRSKGFETDKDFLITNVRRNNHPTTIIASKHLGNETSYFMLKF